MRKYQLGEFEEVVMLTVGILYNEAYGVSIKKKLKNAFRVKSVLGHFRLRLKRLEDKGYLKSREGESTEERAGDQKNILISQHLVNVYWNIRRVPGMNSGEPFRKSRFK